ncbi:MAG: hypothetical protein WAN69_20070 [Candidatus Korobacteraceae bacterium]
MEKWRDRRFILLSFVLIVAAIISRRPDALFNPQFWAEDGAVWFTDAYNTGVIHALSLPIGGDFQTFPRLAVAIAMMFPLHLAPMVTNLLAIFIQALPPVFLLTERFAYLGSRRIRLLMSFLLLAVPTSFEVHANVSNSMTFLALLAFLVLIAEPPQTKAWRTFDIVVVCLSGATGPFSVFLLPIAILMFWFRRRRWTGVLLVIEACAATVQGLTILRTAAILRSPAPLGATPMLLFRVVGGQVIVSPLLGMDFLVVHPGAANAICCVAFACASVLLVYVFLRAPLELRLLMVFSISLLAAALRKPQVSLTQPQWQVMTLPGCGGRYWLIPVASFLWIYVWMLGRARPALVRAVGALAVAAALCTGVAYWRYQPFVNFDFPKYAYEFQRVPAGQDFAIPINPAGWKMVLHKH